MFGNKILTKLIMFELFAEVSLERVYVLSEGKKLSVVVFNSKIQSYLIEFW